MGSETPIVRECLTACAHSKIQILDPQHWNKKNPPPFMWEDPAIVGVAWRNNTGAVRYGAKQERFVRFGIPGAPDIEGMIRGGRRFGLEVKQEGGRPSVYQIWYHTFMGGLGMYIAIVRGYQDTLAALKQWGVVK